MHYVIANCILSILPPTRFFGVKRYILRSLGIGIGPNTRVCGAVKFYGGGRVEIGGGCWVGIGVKFYTTVGNTIYIGDNCDIAPEVSFMGGSHAIGAVSRRAGTDRGQDIIVHDGCWIGIRSTILGGCVIHAGSVVAACSLLLGKTYEGSSLWAGTPGIFKKALP